MTLRDHPRASVLFSACALGLSLCSTRAGAQVPPPPAAPSSAAPQASAAARADALFQEGVALRDAGNHAAACARFEESHKLDPAPATLFNIATCEEGQGHFAAAARRWREARDLLPPGDPKRAAAEANAMEDEGKAGRLVLRAPPGAPRGMVVTLDGRALGEGELGPVLVVDPGEHRVVVTAPDHEPRELTVDTASGETKEATVAPGPAVPPAVTAPPGPTVTAPPGPTVTAPSPAPSAEAPATGLARHKASIATLGGGVALAIAGTAVAIDIVSGRYSAFVQKCAAGCPQGDRDAMQGQAIAVNALFIAAGAAGLAAAGIFFFAERQPDARDGTQVGLAVGPAGVTLTVRR